MNTYGKEIHTLLKMMDALRQATDEKVSVPALYAFLQVALEPGITMQKLAEVTNISMPSVTRNIQLLGRGRALEKSGYGLVEAVEDPIDSRRKIVYLTPAGRNLASQLVSLLLGKVVTVDSPTAKQALQATYGRSFS